MPRGELQALKFGSFSGTFLNTALLEEMSNDFKHLAVFPTLVENSVCKVS